MPIHSRAESPAARDAPGGQTETPVAATGNRGRHFVTGNPIRGPFAEGLTCAAFALGCFWGAERIYWQLPGVHSTAVGYAGGRTADPTYAEVCGGATGHAEAVLVVYDPAQIGYDELLRVFWESHDPTQGMRQGNDHGTQYRSVIFAYDTDQQARAERSKAAYQARLSDAGYGAITTEIPLAPAVTEFHYAENPHQQYLAKNPGGYCGLGGTGVRCA